MEFLTYLQHLENAGREATYLHVSVRGALRSYPTCDVKTLAETVHYFGVLALSSPPPTPECQVSFRWEFDHQVILTVPYANVRLAARGNSHSGLSIELLPQSEVLVIGGEGDDRVRKEIVRLQNLIIPAGRIRRPELLSLFKSVAAA